MAACGGGPCDSRGQRLCGSALTSGMPLLVPRRDTMISPQRHRDNRVNPEFVAGDRSSPSPGVLCLGGEDLCETNPISSSLTETRTTNCAKRSQTWAGWNIWGTAHPEGRGRPARDVRNEPNWRRVWSLKCYTGEADRISQHPAILSLHHSSPMAIVRNKANHRQSLPRAQRGDADATRVPNGQMRSPCGAKDSLFLSSMLVFILGGHRQSNNRNGKG